jgi:hypothetical protein
MRRLSKKDATPSKVKILDENDERLHDIHNANGLFSCFCSVCFKSSKPVNGNTLHKMPTKLSKTMTRKETEQLFDEKVKGMKQDFLWLMEHLLPCSDKLKGCELIFPDTIFF